MSERPIIFSGPMVRAILEGRKTQTRRIVKPQPDPYSAMRPEPRAGRRWVFMAHSDRPGYAFATGDVQCPYGVPGDRLWVRETWAVSHVLDHLKPREVPQGPGMVYYAATENLGGLLKRPSLFMPRWASRITLEVVSVRVERLQEISEADAEAEGVDRIRDRVPLHRDSFRYLWDSINAKRAPWESNPWVWVIEFRRHG